MFDVLVGERRFGADQGRQLAGLERPGAVRDDLHITHRHGAEEIARGAGGRGVARAERRERIEARLHHELHDAVGLLDGDQPVRDVEGAGLVEPAVEVEARIVLHKADTRDDAVDGQLAERSGVEDRRVDVVGERRPHRRIGRGARRRRRSRRGGGRRRAARLIVGGRRAGEAQRHRGRAGAQPQLQCVHRLIPLCLPRPASPGEASWARCPRLVRRLSRRLGGAIRTSETPAAGALPARRPCFERPPGRAAAFLISACRRSS